MIKGLLTSTAKSAATNTAKQAVKKTTAGGMKKFAKGMTGKTSNEYRRDIIDGTESSGEYVSPEERKARFKGFTLGTKKQQDAPTAARLALPAGSDSDGGSKGAAGKLTDHLVKVKEYLEKLLVLENNAIGRLHDRILGTAREIDKDAADSEESKQERGKVKTKKKKDGPLMKGIKKKAGGIFDFLMTFGKAFVGFKLLEWLGDPANQQKVTDFVAFFQGVVKFIGDVGKAIGQGFTWTVDKLQEGVQLVKDTFTKLGEFFSFQWFDQEAFQEQLDTITKVFTEGIPKLFDDLKNWLLVDLPEMFAGISSTVGDFFQPVTNFFTETIPNMLDELTETVGNLFDPVTSFFTETIPNFFNEITSNVFGRIKKLFGLVSGDEESDEEIYGSRANNKAEKGGLLTGPRHSGGGVPIEAEGGEYILNRKATAGMEQTMPGFLDAINFGRFPASGSSKSIRPTFKSGGYVSPTFNAGTTNIISTGSGSSFNPSFTIAPKFAMGGKVPVASTKIVGGRNANGIKLNIAQNNSNNINLSGLSTDNVIINDQGTHFTAGAEETAFDSGSLGDNLPPFHQCVYGVRL